MRTQARLIQIQQARDRRAVAQPSIRLRPSCTLPWLAVAAVFCLAYNMAAARQQRPHGDRRSALRGYKHGLIITACSLKSSRSSRLSTAASRRNVRSVCLYLYCYVDTRRWRNQSQEKATTSIRVQFNPVPGRQEWKFRRQTKKEFCNQSRAHQASIHSASHPADS